METSLHRQLKELYADGASQLEAPVNGFRIDVVRGDELIEIQHGSLAAIRDKIAKLVNSHRVLVVKPLVARKQLLHLDHQGGRVVRTRLSPKQGQILNLFDELIYFTRVFPHPNLTLEVPLVDIEELRYPGHGRRRRYRRRDHQVQDQRLVAVHGVRRFHLGSDLLELLPDGLPAAFHTGHVAQGLGIPRWMAQRIAYCLRKMKLVDEVGKDGNSRLYRLPKCACEAA